MLKKLWTTLDFRLSEVLQFDLLVGVLGCAGGVVAALNAPKALVQAVPVAASIVGVVIGAVIAGAAIQAAFLDQPFLRKIRAIDRDPVRYLAPFIFTAVLGVFSCLLLLIASTLSADSAEWALVAVGGLGAFFSTWAIASLLPCLSTLIQFIHLKVDALDVPDDIGKPD